MEQGRLSFSRVSCPFSVGCCEKTSRQLHGGACLQTLAPPFSSYTFSLSLSPVTQDYNQSPASQSHEEAEMPPSVQGT